MEPVESLETVLQAINDFIRDVLLGSDPGAPTIPKRRGSLRKPISLVSNMRECGEKYHSLGRGGAENIGDWEREGEGKGVWAVSYCYREFYLLPCCFFWLRGYTRTLSIRLR